MLIPLRSFASAALKLPELTYAYATGRISVEEELPPIVFVGVDA